ncbi:MAG TPA: sulfatase [Spirochaetia bacterium]|nr:sulfatase [Spirochaetia bacterium]
MNIIVVCADTFRRDYLGCYGNTRIHTPHLNQLSKDSLIFDRHYTASFPTMPARADWFTGRWTFTYMGWNPLSDTEVVLAEELQKAGYTTLGVADTPFFDRKGYNYDRGFDEFIRVPGQEREERERWAKLRRFEEDCCAPKTVIGACRLLEYYHKQKFFLYVDTWDPHEPWNAPDWYTRRYMPKYDGRLVAPCYAPYQDQGLSDADVATARAAYAGEVTMVDRWIGFLLEKVDSMNLTVNTAILFLTDHGFYFGEHGGLFGKMTGTGGTYATVEKQKKVTQKWFRSPLYEELVHIPLLLRVPGQKPGRTAALTSAVDIMPTLLELAGEKIPQSVQGTSLLPAFNEKSWAGHTTVFSSLPLYNLGEKSSVVDQFQRDIVQYQPVSITSGSWNLHYSAAGEQVELFDLVRDASQTRDVSNEHQPVVHRLHNEFVELLECCPVNADHKTVRMSL